MTPITPKTIRCAIYTRKSSEEGLDQSFNSLHAQREACEAFVLSQKHEGWQVLPAAYDDGGFSGGNMERPGLRHLLEDIAAGRVDTVVVYKVDRLTRALSDFARIVESFDSKGVSFVSVTQQFNTTSSMGRLTLNVLLSFAQFEREVTGERIRDKVAASKRKGIWMGGNIPLGYDLRDRHLFVNTAEADTVRMIFREYLRLGSVFNLQEDLTRQGVVSKRRTCSTGRVVGGYPFSRGTLYHLLSNQLYIGKISHRGEVYNGLHEAIVDPKTWAATADMLKSNGVKRITSRNLPSERPLLGLMSHVDGSRFIPSHASKKGRRYAYYVAQPLVGPRMGPAMRLPATEVEQAVMITLRSFLLSSLELAQHFAGLAVREISLLTAAAQHRAEQISGPSSKTTYEVMRRLVKAVVVGDAGLSITLSAATLGTELLGTLGGLPSEEQKIDLWCPFQIKRRGSEVRIVLSNGAQEAKSVASLGRAVARAHDWAEQIAAGKIETMGELVQYSGMTRFHVRQLLRCAVLSPELTEALLDGRHPVDLSVVNLTRSIPNLWDDQCLQRG